MNVPDPKRQKMSDGKGEKWIFKPYAVKFEDIVDMPAYIDHSSLIEDIFNGPKNKLIVAPSRFCKSLNMEMVRSFFEIETHSEKGRSGESIRNVKLPAESLKDLEGLKNYKLFLNGNCEILKAEDFVKEHFGRYPVIKLDFVVDEISSFTDAVDHCKTVIRTAFQQHLYLIASTKLVGVEINNRKLQTLCQRWSCDVSYEEMSKTQTKLALEILIKCLHNHFERKVIVLVDEFDAILNAAMFSVNAAELSKISSFLVDVLGPALKGDSSEQVEIVFMTGISIVEGTGISNRMATVNKYKFLQEEIFARFYGIDEKDLNALVEKLKKDNLIPMFAKESKEDIVANITKEYNGYYSPEGKCILSLWSVLHYLQEKKLDSHVKTKLFRRILELFKYPRVGAKILHLTGKETGEVTIDVPVSTIEVEDLKGFISPMAPNQEPNVNLVMNYMRELGYLSSVQNKPDKVKIANEEIRRVLLCALVTCDISIAGFDSRLISLAADMFSNLINSYEDDADQFNGHLICFHETLGKLFDKFKSLQKIDINESAIMSLMYIVLGKIGATRFASDCPIKNEKGETLTRGRPDILMIYHDIGIIVEIKYANSKRGTEQDKKETSLYALQQILGVDEKLSYLNGLKGLAIKKFLLLGLSMTPECEPSISYLRNLDDLNKVVCVSKVEPERHSEYYRNVTVI